MSVAGLGRGMKRGSNTRSGLLWEVQRILEECEELPQVLLMENVPQVHGEKNLSDFNEWIDFLSSKGYQNFWQDLNAKDYGIPQNRQRCFMVSILSDGYVGYEFPGKKELKKVLKDLLEDCVDEKYYIDNEKTKKLIEQLIMNGGLESEERTTIDLCLKKPRKITIANCIKAKYDTGISNLQSDGSGVMEVKKLGNYLGHDSNFAGTVYDKNGLSPTLRTPTGGNTVTMIRIRKLTPRECWRLMGFSDTDFDKASAVNSNTQLYKQAGNSIVVNVLMGIFEAMIKKENLNV